MDLNQAGDYVNICALSKHALTATGATALKLSLVMFRRRLTTLCWEIDRKEFDDVLDIDKEAALGLMEFDEACADVREAWVLGFSSTHTNMFWWVALFLFVLPKVELSLFPSLPTSTTMEGL